jgi:hypothetical protein
MGAAGQSEEPKYEVTIEGKIYPWDKDKISVQEIRELGGLPPDCEVVAVNFTDGTENPLAEGAVHPVVPKESGKPLTKRMGFKCA